MPAPTKESILLAMKSDLGLGRVDDLELENGCKGRTIRPGDASHVLPDKAVAPPRKILPVANKWIVAIKKGDFDDDDAEAVKGLDRIGGGRLHALNFTPSVPAKNFPTARRPPPGLPPPGLGALPVLAPGFSKHRFSPVPAGNASNDTARHLALLSKSSNKASQKGSGQESKPVKGSSFKIKDPVKPTSFNTGTKTPAPQPPTQGDEVVYPPDPEPPNYTYKETIYVADRLAKGSGAVYLVDSSPSDNGTIHIYLKGSRYLDYPVLSMCNYISSSTILCPQFKEKDGVSIVTTSLVFASQEKMVKFMTAIKSMQARKPTAGVPATQPSTPKPANVSASAAPVEKMPAELTVTARDPAVESEPMASESTDEPNEPKQLDLGFSCDLVDLSQPEESTVSEDMPTPRGLSVYAMDLGSLTFSFPETLTESCVSKNGLDGLRESSDDLGSMTPKTESLKTDDETSQPVVSSPERPQKEISPQRITQADPPQTPVEVQEQHASQQPVSTEIWESLQSHLLDILPKYEAMSKLLSSFEENNREPVAKSIFARLREKKPETADFQLSSAEQLLRTLVAKSKKHPGFPPPKLVSSETHPRYDIVDMILLRKHAVMPPKKLFELDFMPRTENCRVIKSENAPPVYSPKSAMSTPKRSNLKPDAKPFQPSPVSDRTLSEPEPQFASFSMAPEMQTPVVSPTALSEMSHATNLSNMELLTASMARLALPDTKPAVPVPAPTPAPALAATSTAALAPSQVLTEAPVQGLRGSRWATTNDSSKGTNRFS